MFWRTLCRESGTSRFGLGDGPNFRWQYSWIFFLFYCCCSCFSCYGYSDRVSRHIIAQHILRSVKRGHQRTNPRDRCGWNCTVVAPAKSFRRNPHRSLKPCHDPSIIRRTGGETTHDGTESNTGGSAKNVRSRCSRSDTIYTRIASGEHSTTIYLVGKWSVGEYY